MRHYAFYFTFCATYIRLEIFQLESPAIMYKHCHILRCNSRKEVCFFSSFSSQSTVTVVSIFGTRFMAPWQPYGESVKRRRSLGMLVRHPGSSKMKIGTLGRLPELEKFCPAPWERSETVVHTVEYGESCSVSFVSFTKRHQVARSLASTVKWCLKNSDQS